MLSVPCCRVPQCWQRMRFQLRCPGTNPQDQIGSHHLAAVSCICCNQLQPAATDFWKSAEYASLAMPALRDTTPLRNRFEPVDIADVLLEFCSEYGTWLPKFHQGRQCSPIDQQRASFRVCKLLGFWLLRCITFFNCVYEWRNM